MGGSRWRFGHEGTFHGIEIGGACGPVAGSGNGNLGAVHPIQYNSGHNADGTINAWNSADGARQGSAGAEHGAGISGRECGEHPIYNARTAARCGDDAGGRRYASGEGARRDFGHGRRRHGGGQAACAGNDAGWRGYAFHSGRGFGEGD